MEVRVELSPQRGTLERLISFDLELSTEMYIGQSKNVRKEKIYMF